jgi:hypothetical protein
MLWLGLIAIFLTATRFAGALFFDGTYTIVYNGEYRLISIVAYTPILVFLCVATWHYLKERDV